MDWTHVLAGFAGAFIGGFVSTAYVRFRAWRGMASTPPPAGEDGKD
jgi:hypothetical protein